MAEKIKIEMSDISKCEEVNTEMKTSLIFKDTYSNILTSLTNFVNNIDTDTFDSINEYLIKIEDTISDDGLDVYVKDENGIEYTLNDIPGSGYFIIIANNENPDLKIDDIRVEVQMLGSIVSTVSFKLDDTLQELIECGWTKCNSSKSEIKHDENN